MRDELLHHPSDLIPESMQTLLEALKALYPDSSNTTLRKILQSGRVRVNGEVEKEAKRIIDAAETVDVAPKTVQQALRQRSRCYTKTTRFSSCSSLMACSRWPRN